MATISEEILILIRAELDNRLQELDQAREKIQSVKAAGAGALDLGAEDEIPELDAYDQALARAREQLQRLKDSTDRLAASQEGTGDSTAALGSTIAVTTIAVIGLRQQMEELEKIGGLLSERFPELAELVERTGERIKAGLTGPLGFLRETLQSGGEAWDKYLTHIENAGVGIHALSEAQAFHQERILAYKTELEAAAGALEREVQAIVFAAAQLQEAAKEDKALALQLSEAAEELIERLQQAGREVPANLQAVADAYRGAAQAARDLTAAQREQARAQEIVQEHFKDTTARLEDFEDAVSSMIQRVGGDVGQLDDELNVLVTAFERMTAGGVRPGTEALAAMREEVEDLRDNYKAAGQEVPESLQALLNRLPEVAEETKKVGDEARKARQELEGLADAADAAAGRRGLFGTTPEDVEELEQRIASLSATVDRLQQKRAAQGGILSAEDHARLIRAQDDLTASQADLARATSDLGDVTEDLGDTFDRTADQLDGFFTATEIGGRAVDDLTGRFVDQEAAQRRLANENIALRQAQDDTGESTQTLKERVKELEEQLEKLVEGIAATEERWVAASVRMEAASAGVNARLETMLDLLQQIKECEEQLAVG